MRPKGKTLRRKLDRQVYDDDLEERILWGNVDNYVGHDVSDLIIESYIIGSDSRKKTFFYC